jgi:hypothetical protein
LGLAILWARRNYNISFGQIWGFSRVVDKIFVPQLKLFFHNDSKFSPFNGRPLRILDFHVSSILGVPQPMRHAILDYVARSMFEAHVCRKGRSTPNLDDIRFDLHTFLNAEPIGFRASSPELPSNLYIGFMSRIQKQMETLNMMSRQSATTIVESLKQWCSPHKLRKIDLNQNFESALTNKIQCRDYRLILCTEKRCEVRVRTQQALAYHEFQAHGKTKPIQCPSCPERFCSSSALALHQKARHDPDFKGFPCRFCSQLYQSTGSKNRHEMTHTGEKPYVCDFPGYTSTFAQSGHLTTHKRTHKRTL